MGFWRLAAVLFGLVGFGVMGIAQSPPIPKQDQPLTARRSEPSSLPKTVRANCGPIVLQKVLEKHGIKSTVDELIPLSRTRHGQTTLFDLGQAAIQKGLHAEAIQTDIGTLVDLMRASDVICHFSENNHYILMRSVGDKQVEFFDPGWAERNDGIHKMWRQVFEKEWKGVCLVLSRKPIPIDHFAKPAASEKKS